MNEAVFKTTMMGGFNKSDVLTFIDKQDKQFRDREMDLLARVESLSRDLKNEAQKTAELAQQVSLLGSQLEQAQSQSAEADQRVLAAETEAQEAKNSFEQALLERDAELDRLRTDAAKMSERLAEAQRNMNEANAHIQLKGGLEQMLAERDAELDHLRREKADLIGRLADAERQATEAAVHADAAASKLEQIDKTEDQIGRALLQAQQTADRIIRSAKDEADLLVFKGKAQVKALNAAEKQKLDMLLLAVSDYERRIAQARSEAAAFFASSDSAFDSMRDGAQDILKNFTDAFRMDEPESAGSDSEREGDSTGESAKFDFSKDGGSESD